RLRDLLGLVPGDHPAVARQRALVGQALVDVVVLHHQPEPVERHLGEGMHLVGGGGLGAPALDVVVELGGLVEREDDPRQLARRLVRRRGGGRARAQQAAAREGNRSAQQRAARDPPGHGASVRVETWSSPMVARYGTKPRARERRMSSAPMGPPSAAAYSMVNTGSPSAV